ncbi:NUDIX hydrolase [Streptomyces sp. NPDC004658]|uniref:NUDIX hydrolase n=1 Tax=Streptomyces sp. NPDC004658 TaxID=3154672 RepID=UPI0033B96665
MPCGRVEDGEGVLEALRRETAEETGPTIEAVCGYVGHFDYADSRGGTTRQFTFAVTVRSTAPLVLTEHDAHRWADPADLPPVSDAVRALIGRWPPGSWSRPPGPYPCRCDLRQMGRDARYLPVTQRRRSAMVRREADLSPRS